MLARVAHRSGVQPLDFFRLRLLRITDPAELRDLLTQLRREQRDLRRHVHDLMWHMRGSLGREEAWSLSPLERKDLLKLIEDRMKIAQKSGVPMI